jgi:hypothetical protein
MWDRTGESRVYARQQKTAEEQMRFDKTEMLSFLPPEITAAGTSILPRRFKLYDYLWKRAFNSTWPVCVTGYQQADAASKQLTVALSLTASVPIRVSSLAQ